MVEERPWAGLQSVLTSRGVALNRRVDCLGFRREGGTEVTLQIQPATTSGYTIRWSPFWTPPSTSVQFSSRRRPPSLWSRE